MILLENCRIVTGQYDEPGALIIEGEKIADICLNIEEDASMRIQKAIDAGAERVDLKGKMVMAGGIDLHVHFRDPGLTHKADLVTESAAAVLGGVTSFVDMPNTRPATTTAEALKGKLDAAKGRSYANYGFHYGATNDNAEAIEALIAQTRANENEYSGLTRHDFCGVKVFMGSSTGNMLVDRDSTLQRLFSIKGKPVLIHSEDEGTIRENLAKAKEKFGENIPMSEHPNIRSRIACIKSTIKALEMAMELKTRLHVLHISTREEADMVRAAKLQNAQISGETSANYLWFCDEDYARLGSRCKCNPAIKAATDRDYLAKALESGDIDTIGSDHAPHLKEEKTDAYLTAPSGLPSIQFQLRVLMTLAAEGKISYTTIARAISERPAEIGGIPDRGFLKAGQYADLVIADPEQKCQVTAEEIASKCGWSPYEGVELTGKVTQVYLNGQLAAEDGKLVGEAHGQQLWFD